ncbi:MAG: hypothetical protein R3195_18890 [Gemmatimonadota bacterium]|nr:hypothetical protein [Gemmatimonadota bacterium]
MTHFEYLAIAFSLLYSLAALRLLGGLPAAMAPERRDVLHLGATLVFLYLVAISFWVFWSLRDIRWTFAGFLAALAVPGVLFYCAASLIPENPETVTSWRDHYFAVHRRLYGGLALWGVAAALSATVNLGMGLSHPARLVHAMTVGVGIAGAGSASTRLHGWLVGLMCALSIGSLAAQFPAGWLADP